MVDGFFYEPLFTFGAGFLVSLGAIAIILRTKSIVKTVGMDFPDGIRKTHERAIPRIGGICVFSGFVVVVLFVWLSKGSEAMAKLPALFVGTSLIFILGFLDDLFNLAAKVKLAGQLAIATLAWHLGLEVQLLTNPFNGASLELSPAISFFATILWLVAIPNVVNLADGMDGLAGGIGLFLSLTLGIVGLLAPGHEGLAAVAFGLSGAVIAFLIFNFPPAKIFLGDGGAYFIGFFIAAASLSASQKSYVGASLMITLIALGLPILDTLIAFTRRAIKGVPIMRGDAEHIHHRLLVTGMSTNKALFIIYGVFLALSILSLATFLFSAVSIWLAVGFLALFALITIRALGYVESWRRFPEEFHAILLARREMRYACMVSQVLEMEIERQTRAEVYWEIFEEDLARLGLAVEREVNPEGEYHPTITLHYPFKGVSDWVLTDFGPEDPKIKIRRKAIAARFITALCLGMRKFGHPGWSGLVTNSNETESESANTPLVPLPE